MYTGAKAATEQEFLLVFDPKSNEFVMEKQAFTVVLKQQRQPRVKKPAPKPESDSEFKELEESLLDDILE